MRSKTMNASAGTGKTLDADDHRQGLQALSPLALLILIVICGAAYVIFSLLQITSTEQSVFGLLQVGVQMRPTMTAAEVQQLMTGSLNRYQTIASAIGWGVQIALLMLSFPPDTALLAMHRKYTAERSVSLSKNAEMLGKLRQYMMFILVAGDVLTDFLYVAGGHALFIMNGWLPSLTNPGVLLVGIVYPVAICFVTIFVGKYIFVFIDALIDHLRGIHA